MQDEFAEQGSDPARSRKRTEILLAGVLMTFLHCCLAVSSLTFALGTSCASPPIPEPFPEADFATSSDGVSIRYEVEGLGKPALIGNLVLGRFRVSL